MKISLELIARELETMVENLSIQGVEDDKASKMVLSGVYPLLTSTKYENDRLYLVNLGDTLLYKPIVLQQIRQSGATICCLHTGEEKLLPPDIPCLYCWQGNTPANNFYDTIYQALYQVFQKYNDWQQLLFDALQENNLQQMLDVSYPIFSVNLSLFDKELNCIAACGPPNPFIKDNQLPVEYVSLMKEDSHSLDISQRKNSFLGRDPFDYFGSDGLCYNFFIFQDYFCRLVAMNILKPHTFLKSEYELMNILGKNMQLAINQKHFHSTYFETKQTALSGIISILERLLNQENVKNNEFNNTLLKGGWPVNGSYYIGYLFLNRLDVSGKNSSYYCWYITQNFPGVYTVDCSSYLVLIIKTSKYPQIEHFLNLFNLFLREGNFRLGVSNLCKDLMQIYYYYRQGEIAYTYGMQKNGTIWCHMFKDYQLDYLLQPMRDMPVQYLYAEELLTLMKYDAQNNTNYFDTLKAYIDNQMNAVKTAKQLFIHHATMVFRLKRLEELTNINYKDTPHMVYLYLSYKMLEMG